MKKIIILIYMIGLLSFSIISCAQNSLSISTNKLLVGLHKPYIDKFLEDPHTFYKNSKWWASTEIECVHFLKDNFSDKKYEIVDSHILDFTLANYRNHLITIKSLSTSVLFYIELTNVNCSWELYYCSMYDPLEGK